MPPFTPSRPDSSSPHSPTGTPQAPARPDGIRWLWGLAGLLWCALGIGLLLLKLWPTFEPVHSPVPSVEQTQTLTPAWPCLSYAPFRRHGHTPLDPSLRLTKAQILEDLQLLSPWTRCIRTYGTDHGQDQIPELASSLGLRVVQGAWISRDRAASSAEVQRALALAQAYPDTIGLLVMGNEVLLRQERSPQELAALLREARQRSPVPVAYADVWEFWLRHAPTLAPAVDVVAAHILPYWEDTPMGLDQAVSHVLSIHGQLRQAFGAQPVWVAETGWPAAGRQRGPAVPGPQEQAQFLRELRDRTAASGIEFNVIEAFDQPWKRRFEGAMGGAWGVADAQGRLRDRGRGPLPRDPSHVAGLAGAGAGMGAAALGLLLAHVWARRSAARAGRNNTAVKLGVLAAGGTLGLLAGLHLAGLAIWQRDAGEWTLALAHAALALALALYALWCAARSTLPLTAVAIQGVLAPARYGFAPKAWSTACVTPLLCLSTVQALTLVFDGRYRPLPAALLGMVAVSLWLCRATGGLAAISPVQRSLGLVLAGFSGVLVAVEGPANTQAHAVAAAWALLGATLWVNTGDNEGGAHPPAPV